MAGREKRRKKSLKDRADVLARRSLQLRTRLKENSLDAFIVSAAPNRYYLTGWQSDSESGWVIVTANKSYVLTDSRYTEHAISETKGFEIVEYESSLPAFFGEFAKKRGFSRVGFESHDLSIFDFKRSKKFCRGIKLIPVAHLVEGLRSIKDPAEISKLKKAVDIADSAFSHALNSVKPGQTEGEIAWEMEKFMRDRGAEKMAWDPFIVASGANSSMAHWGAGNRKIAKNDMVLVDYGCVWEGYHCDISRVFFVGRPSDEQKKIYNLVLDAQKLGKSLVMDGKVGAIIDKKVRSFMEKNTKHFYRHSLGHGIGLEVHELPRLSIHSKNKLRAGNVLTVEPGIYVPGWGGVRIEDIVEVTKDGCNVLTKAPKDISGVTV